MNRYCYHPLPPINEIGPDVDYTRLMTIFPGAHSDIICCTLEIVDIKHSQPFEALSYVWGKENCDIPLLCNDASITVTANLDRALRHLRWHDRARTLWVDAVCINQESSEERSRQVKYMRLIYKHALCVIAWLGLKTPGVEQAFEFAKTLAQLRNDLFSNSDLYGNVEANTIMFYALSSQPESADQLTQLFDRKYFERVWCVQEVVASIRCLAKCEDLEIDFFKLLSNGPYIEERRGIAFPPRALNFWCTAILRSRLQGIKVASANQWKVEGSIGQLLTLLMGVRDFKSTDERDMIYALLGILDEGLEPVMAFTHNAFGGDSKLLNFVRRAAIWTATKASTLGLEHKNVFQHTALKPNYEKSVKDVYRDLTRFLIRRASRVLDALSHVQHTSDPSEDSFPSWVPKWYEPRSVSVLSFEPFRAGIPAEGHYRYFAEVHDNPLHAPPLTPDSLQLDGFSVDQVEAISEVIQFRQNGPLPAEYIWNQLFDVPLFPRPNRQYIVNGEALDVAFFVSLHLGPLGGLQSAVPRLAKMENSNAVAVDVSTLHDKANIAAWLKQQPKVRETPYPELDAMVQGDRLAGNANAFVRTAWSFCLNRRFYRTSSGFIGIGPQVMRSGDQVYVLLGGRLPFILRPKDGHFILIGEAYLHHENILRGREVIAVKSGKSSSKTETLELK